MIVPLDDKVQVQERKASTALETSVIVEVADVIAIGKDVTMFKVGDTVYGDMYPVRDNNDGTTKRSAIGEKKLWEVTLFIDRHEENV